MFHCAYIDKLIEYIYEQYINSSAITQKAKNNYQLLIDEIVNIKNEYKAFRK